MRFKLFSTILFTLIIMASLAGLTFATSPTPVLGGEKETVSILFAENTLENQNPILVINGEIMIPTRAFFDKLNAQVYWIDDSNEFIVYRDNTFLKLKLNEPTAQLNGKHIALPVRCFMHAGQFYVPLSTVASAFDLTFTHDAISGKVILDFKQGLYQYQLVNHQYFKRINVPNWGISFYIPEFWEHLDSTAQVYGFETPYESYQFEINLLPTETTFNRTLLIEAYKSNLLKKHGDALVIESSKTFHTGNYAVTGLYYSILEGTQWQHHIVYVLFENNMAYIFNARYGEDNDVQHSKDIFDYIVTSFLINKLALNERQEHYIELSPFFDYDVVLHSTLYSNMVIENELEISGLIGVDSNVLGIMVAVTKDKQRMDYYIPVTGGAFKGTIHTPFGLGKHNVSFSFDIKRDPVTSFFEDPDILPITLDDYISQAMLHDFSLDSSQTFLKLSLINTSSEAIKDLLPSEFIKYDTPGVYAVNSRVTYNLTSEYAKARALYEWIFGTYMYKTDDFEGDIKSLETLINSDRANGFELCLIYTGLLRANDIPARIVRGMSDQITHYWVETYINGKWLIADIAKEVSENTTQNLQYFNLSRSFHYSLYEAIEALPF